MKLTIPTWLTLLRIVLIPVLVAVFYMPSQWTNFASAFVFILAAVTDWLDGWIARRFHQYSAFGAFLDPVADKLMVAVALFLIVQGHPTPWMAFWAAVIVGREIAVSALREWMAELGQRATVRVALIGKFKTVMQIVAIVVLLHQRDFPELRYYRIGESLLVVAAILTIWSALVYLRAAWPLLNASRQGGSGD